MRRQVWIAYMAARIQAPQNKRAPLRTSDGGPAEGVKVIEAGLDMFRLLLPVLELVLRAVVLLEPHLSRGSPSATQLADPTSSTYGSHSVGGDDATGGIFFTTGAADPRDHAPPGAR
jgi:hypothetical protein